VVVFGITLVVGRTPEESLLDSSVWTNNPAVKGILFGVCCAALYSNCPSSRPLCPLRVLNNRFQSLVSSITLGRVDLNGCSRGRPESFCQEPTADSGGADGLFPDRAHVG
jgi:hypothetical protein